MLGLEEGPGWRRPTSDAMLPVVLVPRDAYNSVKVTSAVCARLYSRYVYALLTYTHLNTLTFPICCPPFQHKAQIHDDIHYSIHESALCSSLSLSCLAQYQPESTKNHTLHNTSHLLPNMLHSNTHLMMPAPHRWLQL